MMRLISSLVFVLAFGLAGMAFAAQGASKTGTLQELKSLESQQRSAKAAYLRKNRDVKLKAAYVAATNKFAYKTMMCPTLGPKEKYPAALRLYRETLKADPANVEAQKWVKQIEDIYRSMGRPIPK